MWPINALRRATRTFYYIWQIENWFDYLESVPELAKILSFNASKLSHPNLGIKTFGIDITFFLNIGLWCRRHAILGKFSFPWNDWPCNKTSQKNYPLQFNNHILIIVKMYANLDEEARNGLVSIVFIRSKCDKHMDGRTEPQQRY